MKYFLLLFILLSAQENCNQKSDLPYLFATSQDWSGGAAGTHGTYYKVYFLMKETSDYTFDSLWTNGRSIPAEAIKSSTPSDTLMILANDYRGIRGKPGAEQMSNSVEGSFPVEMKAEGLLGYFYKGERRYFPIAAWEKLKPIAYP